jgi:hypothetical protein
MANIPAQTEAEQDAALEQALKEAPRGAMTLAFIAVVLLVAAWYAIYLFAFLPRGPAS